MVQASTNPIALPTDTLLGWASQSELELSQRLSDVDYFYKAGVSSDELDRIERFYGTFIARQRAAGADAAALVSITPALCLATLVARAGRTTSSDSFVTEYLAGLGIDDEEFGQAAFDSIRANVDKLSLAWIDGEDASLMLSLHAGITGAEVVWLLSLIDGLEAADKQPTGGLVADVLAAGEAEEFIGLCADEPTDCLYEAGRDMPFLCAMVAAARDLAVEIIDGVIAVRAASIDDRFGWLDRVTCQSTGVPRIIFDQVVAELRERPAMTRNRAWVVGVATREHKPRIIYDVVRNKVCLRLPEQPLLSSSDGGVEGGRPGAVQWRVAVANTTKIYSTSADENHSVSGDTDLETSYTSCLDVAITKQVREVAVADVTHELSWVIDVVDHDDPALIFSEKGFNLTDKASVHYPHLIVISPADASIVDPVSGDDITVTSSCDLKDWPGWVVNWVDCEHAAGLTVVRPSDVPSPAKRARCVDPRQRAFFQHPVAPIESVKTQSGLPVHAESLRAEFPPTLSGTDEVWWLAISGYAGTGLAGQEVSPPEPIEVPAGGGSFDVFDPGVYEEPWVGEYVVRLRGPRGESFRHEYAIVEGMAARMSIGANGADRARMPAGRYLTAATFKAGPTDKPFDMTPSPVAIPGSAARGVAVIDSDGGDRLPVTITPPTLLFELALIDYPLLWRSTQIAIAPRGLDPEGFLRVRLPLGMEKPRVQIRNGHGTPLATVALETTNGVTYRAALTKLAAAATTLTAGTIDLEFRWKDTAKQVSVSLAKMTSQPIVAGAHIDGEDLVVEGINESVAVGLWIWPQSAPWELGRTIALDNEAIENADEDGAVRVGLGGLAGAGPLVVQPHCADLFLPQRAPLAPGPAAFVVEQPGYFRSAREGLAKLSEFLAGGSDEIPDDPSVTSVLWDVMARSNAEGPTAYEAALKVLRAHPSAAIKGLSHSLIPAHLLPGRLIATGLVALPLAGDELITETHRTAWIGILELLAAIGRDVDRLKSLSAQAPASPQLGKTPIKRDDEEPRAVDLAHPLADDADADMVTARLRALIHTVRSVAGRRLVETLSTGRDATLETACVDQATVQIAHMDPAQQKSLLEMFFNRESIVPGPFMDDEARLLAVFECFDRRAALTELLADRKLVTTSVGMLKALRGTKKSFYAAARVRFDKLGAINTADESNMWALTPVISLVCAFVARLRAHGLMRKNLLDDEVMASWAKLADIVPDLVAGDIVSAEAMIISATSGGIDV